MWSHRVNAAGAARRYANREAGASARSTRWGVRLVSLDGTRAVQLDARAARQHVQLAYAVTGYGAQGLTVDEAIQLVDDGTDRPGFYVGATRGRYTNQTALVAENADPNLARRQVEDILGQPGADTGWRSADLYAKADRERMGDLVDLRSRHVPGIEAGQVAEAAEQIARDAGWPDEVRDPPSRPGTRPRRSAAEQRAADADRRGQPRTATRQAAQASDANEQVAVRVASAAQRVGQAEQATRAAQEAVLAGEQRVRHATRSTAAAASVTSLPPGTSCGTPDRQRPASECATPSSPRPPNGNRKPPGSSPAKSNSPKANSAGCETSGTSSPST